MFLISVFVIFNINHLNLCHRNFGENKNHFDRKTFATKILNINSIRFKVAELTYPYFDQHYSKYIFRNSLSHNLQQTEENGDNAKFYWINFVTPLLFLCKTIL